MAIPEFLETDPRFPSGPWVGFFLDKRLAGKHWMELTLTFQDGKMMGDGLDRVGKFVISGTYELDSGRCTFQKSYLGKHTVTYNGFNEGKGIWGTWVLVWKPLQFTGGFHIWPKEMPDPSQPRLSEEAPIPAEATYDENTELFPELLPAGVE